MLRLVLLSNISSSVPVSFVLSCKFPNGLAMFAIAAAFSTPLAVSTPSPLLSREHTLAAVEPCHDIVA